mgnify:CR=1 FL=1
MNNKGYGLNLEIKQKLAQELRLTPALIQTMKIMELSTLELKEKIEKEHLENPFLEEVTTSEESEAAEERPDRSIPEIPEEYITDTSFGDDFTRPEAPEEDVIESTLSYKETLEEHLSIQVYTYFDQEWEKTVATYMIGNLDDKGFLSLSPLDILLDIQKRYPGLDINAEKIAAVREVLQTFDPIGCCSLNPREALLVQIKMHIGVRSLAYRVVNEHWEEFLALKFEEIARTENVSPHDIERVREKIKEFETIPGRQFSDTDVQYITPDVIVAVNEKGELVIILNEDLMSKYRLNTGYYEQINNEKTFSRQEYERMKAKYENALFIMKGIYQRRKSLYMITKNIFEIQFKFLKDGVMGLKPLTLKEIAEKVQMHESTISRITRNKYVQTSSGIYQLKYFFSSKLDIEDENNDEGVASKVVKEHIRTKIAAEEPEKPLSDLQISKLLKMKHGIIVARRTIAKYRESLNIPKASIRKKLK